MLYINRAGSNQMASILKYRDTIRYRYETFKVSSFDWIVLYYRNLFTHCYVLLKVVVNLSNVL